MNIDRIWGLLWIAAVTAVLVLGSMLGIVPQMEEARAANKELTALAAQNAEHELSLAALRNDFANIDDLRDDLVDLQIGIPLTADVPAFVAQLSALAVQHQVTLDQISIGGGVGYVSGEPIAATPADATGTDAAGTDVAGADEPVVSPRLSPENYISVPVSMEASGTSATVLDFLSGLQYGDRIIAINSFSTDAGATADAAIITIDAEIYVLVDPFAQAAE